MHLEEIYNDLFMNDLSRTSLDGLWTLRNTNHTQMGGSDIERRYQRRWDVNILADYYWMLKLEAGNRKR